MGGPKIEGTLYGQFTALPLVKLYLLLPLAPDHFSNHANAATIFWVIGWPYLERDYCTGSQPMETLILVYCYTQHISMLQTYTTECTRKITKVQVFCGTSTGSVYA